MATFFSDHFHSTGTGATSRDNSHIAPTGIDGPVVRYKRMRAAVDSANDDVIRFGSFPSNARILEVLLSTDAADGAGVLDLGLHEAGDNHDGAVIDQDLFDDGQDINASALDRNDSFASGVLGANDRGKRLWELAAIGAGSYTEDPVEMWDLTGTTVTGTDAVNEIVVEVYYVLGS